MNPNQRNCLSNCNDAEPPETVSNGLPDICEILPMMEMAVCNVALGVERSCLYLAMSCWEENRCDPDAVKFFVSVMKFRMRRIVWLSLGSRFHYHIGISECSSDCWIGHRFGKVIAIL